MRRRLVARRKETARGAGAACGLDSQNPCAGSGDSGVDDLLGFVLDGFELVGASEALGVDLVDVFGAGGAGGEPAVGGGDFEAADGAWLPGASVRMAVIFSPARVSTLMSAAVSLPSLDFCSLVALASMRW